jgi:hypothetical protein
VRFSQAFTEPQWRVQYENVSAISGQTSTQLRPAPDGVN